MGGIREVAYFYNSINAEVNMSLCISDNSFPSYEDGHHEVLIDRMRGIISERSMNAHTIARIESLFHRWNETGISREVDRKLGAIANNAEFHLISVAQRQWRESGRNTFLRTRGEWDIAWMDELCKDVIISMSKTESEEIQRLFCSIKNVLSAEYLIRMTRGQGQSSENMNQEECLFAHYLRMLSQRVKEWERAQGDSLEGC